MKHDNSKISNWLVLLLWPTNLANCFCCSSRWRYNIWKASTTSPIVLFGWTIYCLLSCCHCMDGCHQSILDTKLFMHNLHNTQRRWTYGPYSTTRQYWTYLYILLHIKVVHKCFNVCKWWCSYQGKIVRLCNYTRIEKQSLRYLILW